MKHAKLPDVILRALADADRTPGWNNRRRDVRCFELMNMYGHEPCLLYVVPARCWAYRRCERQAAEWQREHGNAQA